MWVEVDSGVDLFSGQRIQGSDWMQAAMIGLNFLPIAFAAAPEEAAVEDAVNIPFGGTRVGAPATGGTSIAWNPLNGPGPLGETVANTFRSGSYTETVLSGDTTFYRVYGGNSPQLGPYWTQTPPAGPLQSTIDSALNPVWGNTAENVATIVVPKGTTVYTGFAAPQGGLVGGGSQVVIPTVNPAWLVK